MNRHWCLKLVLATAAACILIPVALILAWSVTARWPWPDLLPVRLTLRTVRELFLGSAQLPRLLFSSVALAGATAVLGTAVGVLTARATELYAFPGQGLVRLCGLLPLLIPGTVFAIGIHLTLLRLGLADTLAGVLLVHVTVALPYCIAIMGDVTRAVGAGLEEQAAVLGAGTYGGFLLGRVRREEGLPALGRRWTVKLCLVLAAVQLVILGGMGAWLAARSEMPLFLLARDMSIGSAIQRLEGVVVSLWVLSDLTLVALQLWTIAYLIRWLLGIRGRWLPPVLGTAALACGAWWFSDPWTLKKFAAGILPRGNAAAAFLLPAAALAVGRIRRRGKRGGTSCASPPGKTEDIVVGKTGEKKMKKGPEKC